MPCAPKSYTSIHWPPSSVQQCFSFYGLPASFPFLLPGDRGWCFFERALLQHKGKNYTEWDRIFQWRIFFPLGIGEQGIPALTHFLSLSLSGNQRGNSLSGNHSLVNQMQEPGMPRLGRPQQGPTGKGHSRAGNGLREYLGGQTNSALGSKAHLWAGLAQVCLHI